MNWTTLQRLIGGWSPCKPEDDDGGDVEDVDIDNDDDEEDDDPEDDDEGDDEDDDDGEDGDDEDGDPGDDEDDDEEDDPDDGEKAGKGATKRIRQLVAQAKSLKEELAEAKKLSGDDGKAILSAAEASGILPGLMTRDEAVAFRDMTDIPGIIDRYQDWLDDHTQDDELQLDGDTTMSYGEVKKRVRKLRATLDDLKDRYGERRKELTGKVREIFETGMAAIKAGWKPDERKTPAKKKGKKKQPRDERPAKTPGEVRRRGRVAEIEVEDEDSLENWIAADNRKRKKRRES